MTTDGPASSVRHTDPKTRFLAAALISFSVAFATGIPAAIAAVLLSLVLIALFRPNAKELKKLLLAANAFILSSPGTPCVFLHHWIDYKERLKPLILARKACGVSNTSKVDVIKSETGCYVAKI